MSNKTSALAISATGDLVNHKTSFVRPLGRTKCSFRVVSYVPLRRPNNPNAKFMSRNGNKKIVEERTKTPRVASNNTDDGRRRTMVVVVMDVVVLVVLVSCGRSANTKTCVSYMPSGPFLDPLASTTDSANSVMWYAMDRGGAFGRCICHWKHA